MTPSSHSSTQVYIVLLKPQLNSSDHFSKLAANATVTTFLKDANLGSTTASSRQQHQQQVVSFDFDSMFDEYKKSRSHTKSFKESFKHFPRTFRMSSKIKRASTAGGGATGDAHNNNKDNNSNTNSTTTNTPTTEKEKHRRLFKAKNKTLQQLPDHRQRRRNDELRRHQMPPKSMSFNGGEKGRRIPFSLPLTKYQHNNKNNPPAEFFIDFEDSAAKVSIAGSRSGSNISLIKTPPTTTTKENSDNVNSTLNRIAAVQSDHSTTTNQNSIRSRIYDSFKKKNRNSKNNKLTKQKSSSSVDGTIDLGNQSNAAKNNTAAVDQSNGRLTHVNNRSNELVKGMNLEVFDTFVWQGKTCILFLNCNGRMELFFAHAIQIEAIVTPKKDNVQEAVYMMRSSRSAWQKFNSFGVGVSIVMTSTENSNFPHVCNGPYRWKSCCLQNVKSQKPSCMRTRFLQAGFCSTFNFLSTFENNLNSKPASMSAVWLFHLEIWQK